MCIIFSTCKKGLGMHGIREQLTVDQVAAKKQSQAWSRHKNRKNGEAPMTEKGKYYTCCLTWKSKSHARLARSIVLSNATIPANCQRSDLDLPD